MKILLILFLVSTIYAGDLKLASSIFEKLTTAITHEKNPKIYVYSDIDAIKKFHFKFNIVDDCSDADIVLLSTTKDIPSTCRGKVLFGTRYKHLRNEQVIGAFFWQKGRPNILFYKSRLEKKHINLDASLDKYVEDE